MHVWIVEVKHTKDSEFFPLEKNFITRSYARFQRKKASEFHYKARVVKYISSKGE